MIVDCPNDIRLETMATPGFSDYALVCPVQLYLLIPKALLTQLWHVGCRLTPCLAASPLCLQCCPPSSCFFLAKPRGYLTCKAFPKRPYRSHGFPLSAQMAPLFILATAEAGLVSKVWFSSLGHARSGQTSCPELGCILRGISYTDTSLGFTAF